MRNFANGLLVGLLLLIGAWAITASATRDQVDGQQMFMASKNATIAISTTTSLEVDLEDYGLVGFAIPAEFTGTSLTFTCASASGGTFYTLYDSANAAVSLTVATSRHYDLTIGGKAIGGCRYLKIVSGSTEVAARTIPLLLGR